MHFIINIYYILMHFKNWCITYTPSFLLANIANNLIKINLLQF